jgi:hypothetical protein
MNRSSIFNKSRSRAILAGVCSVIFAAATALSAQVTSVKLPKADSSASFRVQDSASVVKLRLNGDGGFYVGGAIDSSVIPATEPGTRMMWYPGKAAFRVGNVVSTQWDDTNTGKWSNAMGGSCIAKGTYSTAMGYNTTASGSAATAMGESTIASGGSSTAMGSNARASGANSIAMGVNATASASSATAIGMNASATGFRSTAMGNYISTNNFRGSFIIGDNSTPGTMASDSNQMTMRFAGGYRLFTNATGTIGASLAAGGNSWGTISDSTKKTGFKKADHEYFLSSLSKLRLGSWNYKSQNAKNYRHYGPMAQEIYHFFGHDGKGTIGCDTLLASADMDGIMMICLQALEKRTGELQKANAQIAELKQQVDEQKVFQQKSIMALSDKIEKLSQLVYSSSKKNREQLTINTSKEELR